MPAIRLRPRHAVMLAATAAVLWGPARAEPAPAYAELLARAASAPRLAVGVAEVDAAQGRLRQAQTWRNPEVSLESENFGGRDAYGSFDQAETTLSLSQTFELGGKRQARAGVARAELAAARAKATLARSDFAAQLAVAYAEAEAAGEKVRQAEELLAAAQTDARSARELVDAGREAELRALQAAADRDAAQADRDEALAGRTAAFARLSALAGSPQTFDGLGESLLGRAPPRRVAGAPTTPAVIAAAAERDVALARVQVERRQAAPDVTVSGGVRRFEAEDATALVAGVSTPLPIFDRNKGARSAAQAELRAAEARLRQAELEAAADLQVSEAQLRNAAGRVEAASAGEASAAEAYRLARIGYEAGRLPLLELTGARRTLASARVRVLDARLARVRAEAEIARLTGAVPFGG